jgi:hypothetical protein
MTDRELAGDKMACLGGETARVLWRKPTSVEIPVVLLGSSIRRRKIAYTCADIKV